MTDDTPAADAATESEIDDQIEKLTLLQNRDPTRYSSRFVQKKLAVLYAARFPGEHNPPAMGPGELDAGAPSTIAVAPGEKPGVSGDEPVVPGDTPAPGLSGDDLAAFRESDADGAAQLETEWGSGFEENVRIAQATTTEFADESLTALLDDTGLGDHPAVINFAAKIGRLRGSETDPAVAMELIERAATEELGGASLVSVLEDMDLMGDPAIIVAAEKIGGFLTGDPGGVADTAGRQGIESRIEFLSSLQNTAPEKYQSEKVQKELRKLYLDLYGTGDASGPSRASLI